MILVSAVFLTGLAFAVAWCPEFQSADATKVALWLALGAWLAGCHAAQRRGGAGAAARERFHRDALCVLLVAALLRLPFVGAAGHTDDLHRYVWEARVILDGHDPYSLAPDAPELAHLVDRSHASINHPSYRSIYPPLAQALFVAVVAAGGRELALRDTLLAIDLLAVVALLVWRRSLGASAWAAIVYAWCPLTVWTAAEGHVDPLALLFLAASGAAAARRRWGLAGVSLGLAASAKVFPIVLLPWLLRVAGSRARALMGFGGAVGAGALLISPLHALAPLSAFAHDFAFNAPIFTWLRDHAVPNPHAAVASAFSLLCAVLWLIEPRFERAAATLLLGLLLLSPTVHAWYLTWPLIAAAAVLPSRIAWVTSAWAVSAAIALFPTYADAKTGAPFVEHRRATQLALLAPLGIGLAGLSSRLRARPSPRSPRPDDRRPPGSTFGVIVPARGEVANLRERLPELAATDAVVIAVVDAPTGDGSKALCEVSPRVRYIAEERPGYGRAVLTGLECLREHGVDYAVVCDADNNLAAAQVEALLAPLGDDAVVLTSGARGRRSQLTRPQRFGNALVCALIAWRFGHWPRDLGPFRALRLSFWRPGTIQDEGYGINVEQTICAARRAGLAEVRLETPMRRHGRSRISGDLRGAARAARGMLRRFYLQSEGAWTRPWSS